jgi:Bacterial SH3 domain
VRTVAAWAFVLLACGAVQAGELVFVNGSRLAGELSSEALMVSTGSGLVEVAADEIVQLSRGELRLRDGRVIQGTLVGDQVKARTALGEIAVKVDELESYRASHAASAPASAPPPPTASPAAAPATSAASATPAARPVAVSGGPTVASYQDRPAMRPGATTASAPTVQPVGLNPETAVPGPARRLEVVDGSPLYRDALFSSARVGAIAPGQQVTYVDSIDRRLRILNRLIFDGGQWVKVRAADGTEGWVPAEHVRDLR